MPELPDVEGFRRVLDDHAVGVRIEHVDVLDGGVLRQTNVADFQRALVGHLFDTPHWHGKWLVAPLRSPRRRHHDDEPSVVFHFGMTGLVWCGRNGAPRHRHDRGVVGTAKGELRYRDMRKLQGIRLAHGDADVRALLRQLGPDACDVSGRELRERLRSLRRQLKPALLDQTVVAGLGNLLVDEINWRAGLHPARSTNSVSPDGCARLHRAMRGVLRRAISYGCVPALPSWLTGQRDDEGALCPRCGTPLRRSRLGGRGTVWCLRCQPPAHES